MSKTIEVDWPYPNEHLGMAAEIPVLVNWFPPLTHDEMVANVLAGCDGLPEPFPDPNLITVRLNRKAPRE